MKYNLKKISATLALGLVSVAPYAQTIITDRPTQSVSTEIIPKGGVQLETGFAVEIMQREGVELNNRSIVAPNTLIRIPVSNRIEFRLGNTLRYNKMETNNFPVEGNWSVDDVQAGFKWKLTSGESDRTQIALMSHVVLPTGSNFNQSFGVINKILVAKSFANGVSTGYNIGYDYLGTGNGNLTYAVNVVFPVHEKIGFYLEPYGAYNNFEDLIVNADAGLTYLLKDKFQLDYSFGIGLNNRMNYHALGFSVLFAK